VNLQAFLAMLGRDGRVARRNFLPLLLQNLVQPMLFVFIFGRVMTTSGMMPESYKSLLLPGVIAISMLLSGLQAVAFPMIADFQFTREIEDRLLAPMEIEWVAIEKVVAGSIQALIAGGVVIPTAWLILGTGVQISFAQPLELLALAVLVALLAAAIGLTLGCWLGQAQIGIMFSLIVGPMIFFGCTYYPWSALAAFPILQKIVLLNPFVYASEGFRSALVPQFPHLSGYVVFGGLLLFNVVFFRLGLRQFRKKAIG
jgi:ABC-2 type transport system permease protein